MRLGLTRADITTLAVDAIVNAANESLLGAADTGVETVTFVAFNQETVDAYEEHLL